MSSNQETVLSRLADFVSVRFYGQHVDEKMLRNAVLDFLVEELGSTQAAITFTHVAEMHAKSLRERKWDVGRPR